MYTKNAIGNLKNRYKAVLNKCNLINNFGSFAKATALCASITVASFIPSFAHATDITWPSGDYFTIEEQDPSKSYFSTFDISLNGTTTSYGARYINPDSDSINALVQSLIIGDGSTYSIALGTADTAAGEYGFQTNIDNTTTNYKIIPSVTRSEDRIGSTISGNIGSDSNQLAFYDLPDTGSVKNGGAIYNTFSNPDADIYADFFANTADDSGGAIFNDGTLGNITGSFIANTSGEWGGAIYNADTGELGDINGSFITNKATSGGAIYNYEGAKLGDITGSFIANTAANGNGGAIYNYEGAKLGGITGSFIANTADGSGGAIYNDEGAKLGDINGSFIANTATNSYGGAIHNDGTLGDITGSFIANTAGYYGGAIYNDIGAKLGDITGSFIANTATNALGGAIYNADTGELGAITGSFIANTAGTNGGAIYNDGTLGDITGSFIANTAGTNGGAIYTFKSLNFVSDAHTNIFTGNMDSSGFNAIYVNAATVDLSFNMQNAGGYVFNDSIRTYSGNSYDVNISGTNSANNVFSLNNNFNSVDTLSVTAANLSLGRVSQGVESSVGRIYTVNASFNGDSILTLDGTAYADNAALQSNGGALTVESGAKIVISGSVNNGQEVKVADGFTDSTSSVNASIVPLSLLQTVETTGFNSNDGSYIVTVNATPVTVLQSRLPGTQSQTSTFLSEFSASTENNVYSSNSGTALFRRLTDIEWTPNVEESLSTIESVLQSNTIVGLNRVAADVSLAAAQNTQSRLTTIQASDGPIAVNLEANASSIQSLSAGSLVSDSHNANFHNGFAAWLMPLYKHSTTFGMQSGILSGGQRTDLGGLTLGADYTWDDMFRVGLAANLGTGFTQSHGDFSQTSHSFDFWGLNLYGGMYLNDFALLADVGVSSIYGDLTQELPTWVHMADLQASTQSTVWTAGLRAEYTFNTDFIDIIPHVGIRYTHVQSNGYELMSVGTVADVSSDSQDIWNFPVGVTLRKQFATSGDWSFTPKVDLGVVVAAGDLNANSRSVVSDVAAEYSMQNVDGLTFSGGLGLDIANTNGISIGVNYNLQASEHVTSHLLNATFRYDF